MHKFYHIQTLARTCALALVYAWVCLSACVGIGISTSAWAIPHPHAVELGLATIPVIARSNAEIVGTYNIGDKQGRRIAEREAIQAEGGLKEIGQQTK
jgi:hypothetical protein